MGPSWGIDIRGHYVEGVVLEHPAATRVLRRLRVPTEVAKGYYHVLGQVHKLVEVLCAEVGVRAERVGVAIPGHLDPVTRTLKHSGLEAFDGKPLASDLQTYLGLDVRLQGGARCMALAETRFGAVTESAPGAKAVFGVLLGERLSGGLVLNGRVYDGRQGIAGSFGHTHLDAAGGPCWCGKHGCAETLLGGPAIAAQVEQLTGRTAAVAELFEGDDPAGLEGLDAVREHIVYNLARALGPVVNVLDPDCILLAGPVAADAVVFEQLPEVLKRFVHNGRLDTLVLRPKLGADAVAIGAALL